jgi:DNA-binding NtrC family response regulator
LVRYDWPGNIRELQNVIERAVILSSGPALQVPLSDLKPRGVPESSQKGETLEEAERKHILSVLNDTIVMLGASSASASSTAGGRNGQHFNVIGDLGDAFDPLHRILGINLHGR